MRIALYRGKSAVSWAIRFITRSPYSHAAFVFDPAASTAAWKFSTKHLPYIDDGSVIEAWQGGVRNSPSISTLHTPGTRVDLFDFVLPLNEQEQTALIKALDADIGAPYSYLNVLRFLTRIPGREDGSWFCSELVTQRAADVDRDFFRDTAAWRVPPDWIARTIALQLSSSVVTS